MSKKIINAMNFARRVITAPYDVWDMIAVAIAAMTLELIALAYFGRLVR